MPDIRPSRVGVGWPSGSYVTLFVLDSNVPYGNFVSPWVVWCVVVSFLEPFCVC